MVAGGSIRRRRMRIGAFVVYATALFTATHWPGLALPEGDVPRPDLYVHLAVFGLWTFLLGASGLTGRWGSARTILVATAFGLAYSTVDEALQAIPALNRHAAWDDLGANAVGVAIGAGALTVAGRLIRPVPDS